MGIDEIQKTLGIDSLSFQGERKAESSEKSSSFSKILGEKQQKCPYSHLAKDGLIEYNGVIFVCDYKRNSICLGDMSNPKNVLNISLPRLDFFLILIYFFYRSHPPLKIQFVLHIVIAVF